MDARLIVALCVGTVLMLGILLVCRKWYGFSVNKTLLLAPVLTFFGFASVKILFFIENGGWTGLSFYGAVLLIPLWFIVVARMIHLPYADVVDCTAPAICAMLALMKVQCIAWGCCAGRILYKTEAGEAVRFPSQIIEMVNAVVIMLVLLQLMRKGKNRGKIYPWFMLIYGITRLFWNIFRETTPYVWILPAGSFWSLVSIVIGIIWLGIGQKRQGNKWCSS